MFCKEHLKSRTKSKKGIEVPNCPECFILLTSVNFGACNGYKLYTTRNKGLTSSSQNDVGFGKKCTD